KQVIYNYLSNAIKFTPEGGRVALRILPEGAEALRIEVEDDGPGISPQDLERLFVEFQQLEGGVTRRFGGTGVGLALTKRLVEAQGGWVGVRSELGRGSTFHAVLPRKTPRGTGWRLPVQEEPRAIAPQRGTVLVVDDDRSSCRLMEAALGQLGYRAECSTDPQAALLLAETIPLAAVVLDLMMPGLDGYAFLEKL